MTYKEILSARYHLNAQSIEPTAGGWSADAFKIRADGATYFLKVYDATRPSVLPWVRRMDAYLPAVAHLQEQQGIGNHMPRLLPNADGAYKERQGDHIFLLFTYIDGTVPGDRVLTGAQIRELAVILSELHSYQKQSLPFPLGELAEDLSLSFCDQLKEALRMATALPDRLQLLLSPYLPELIAAADTALFLRDHARCRCTDLSLCHTDAHNWNLIQGDRLYLLDWEGLCLAPPEADLYAFCERGDSDIFFTAYQAKRPDFSLREPLVYFYAFRRKIEDLWAFASRLIQEDLDKETTELSYKHLLHGARQTVALLNAYRSGSSNLHV